MNVRLSIILVAFHSDLWIEECISSLSKSLQKKQSRYHLILVDNSGNNKLNELDYSGFQTEVLETPKPLGFAAANNFALSNASILGDFILLLNQDTKTLEDWVHPCLDLLTRQSRIGGLSPLIRDYKGHKWDTSFMDCIPNGDESLLLGDGFLKTQVVPAAALILRKEAIEKAGPFDEIYGSYYEDYDLCRRIRTHGYQLGFKLNAHVCHYSGGSTDTKQKIIRRQAQIIRNSNIYRLREYQGLKRFYLATKAVSYDIIRRLFRSLLRRKGAQHPKAVFMAWYQQLKIFARLASSGVDQDNWQKFLSKKNLVNR